MIYRGQLLVRDCGASRKTYSSDTIGTEFRRDDACVGLAEVEKRRYPEHFIRGFLQSGSLSDLRFQTTDFYQRAAFSRGCDLGGLVNETEWPRPDPLFGIGGGGMAVEAADRSEEHTSELQSLMRISYAVFCLKKKKVTNKTRK